MSFEDKVCSPKITFKLFLTILGMLSAMFVWLLNLSMGYAEDMTTLQTQLPAMVKAQEVESDHTREKFDELNEKQNKLETKIDDVNKNVLDILFELRRQ